MAEESRADAPPSAGASRGLRLSLWKVAGCSVFWVAFAVVGILAAKTGLEQRGAIYDQTRVLRFSWDLGNAQNWGGRAAADGFFPLYDDVVNSPSLYYSGPDKPQYELDYGPLRLAIMTAWTRWSRDKYPAEPVSPYAWYPPYQFMKPLLYFNTGIEVASCVAIFLLVYLWVLRRQRPMPPPLLHERASRGWRWLTGLPPGPPALPVRWAPLATHHKGAALGLVGALIFWFNPATTISSHVWPQWDIWPTPFFLWAVLLACLDWWLLAGILLMIGAGLKGQIMITIPLFVLWTVFELRWVATVRLVIGLALGGALVVSPWLLRFPYNDPAVLSDPTLRAMPFSNPAARHWVAGIVLAAGLIGAAVIWRRRSPIGYLAAGGMAAAAACIGLWPWINASVLFYLAVCWVAAVCVHIILRFPAYRLVLVGCAAILAMVVVAVAFFLPMNTWFPKTLLLAVALAGLALLLPARGVPYLLAAALAGGLWACIPVFNASTAWYEISIRYGQYHWGTMVMGTTANLPLLLQQHWGWQVNSIVTVIEPYQFFLWPLEAKKVMLKEMLSYILMGTIVLSALGAAIHHRRNDPRFLVAITVPWIVFYTIPLHVHERYLLWAAGVSALFVAVSWGMTLLGLGVSFLAWLMVAYKIYPTPQARNFAPEWTRFLGQTPLHSISWLVILCAVIYLGAALIPSRRRKRRRTGFQPVHESMEGCPAADRLEACPTSSPLASAAPSADNALVLAV